VLFRSRVPLPLDALAECGLRRKVPQLIILILGVRDFL
jgi:hypothetical protein